MSDQECVCLNERVTVTYYDDEHEEWSQKTVTIRDVLDSVCDGYTVLPSAQPELIRCKDCKYWMPYDWMFSEIWKSQSIYDYTEEEIGCQFCDMSMKATDFCSRAERRS